MRSLRIGLSFLICVQALPVRVYAQTPLAPAELRIVVVEGEGAINNVGQRSGRPPLIRVEDENQKPVAGAAVVFTLPTEGASGEFGSGEKTTIVVTDNRGQAAAASLRANTIPGKLPIHVSASYRGQTARTNITQFNMAVPGKRAGGSGKTWLILLAVGGAAAAGGIAATSLRGSNTPGPGSTPLRPTISIAPGAGTIGPPR